ncbi:hypothetical protein [Hymenobacter cellulosilyticus]|uniref:Rod shape-determining protein MreD n=1 Tax=Hymenobacter cellulosilyticus TaxID=2932248 RepID=A0A8T9Q8R0_9BACT|nr:hypothetical protein [Hymenobacter cellulosilyticus]UOQ73926.1 hypothetical protein MUN79_08520 [Hymenobacter cellulosilyticus]
MRGVGDIIIQLLRFLLYVGLYVFLISGTDFVLFDLGWCILYIGFLLFLPISTPIVVQLLLGFIVGFVVDLFFDTGGLHAAASVLLAYVRPWVLRLLTPRDGYDSADSASIHQMGWQWFVVYLSLLVFIHHTAFFLLELGSFHFFGLTLAKILLSTLYTSLTLLISQLVFFPTRRRSR